MDVDPHAPAGLAYTSGTTGFPKGVIHSQHNLLAPGAYLSLTRGYGPELRKGDCFPLTILNLMVLSTLMTCQARGLAVIMDRVAADVVTDCVRREKVTVWNGPPPLLYTMAHEQTIDPSDLESLQEVWSGGADCPEAIRVAFESKFGTEVRGTYGLTEAPTVVAIEVPGALHADGSSGIPLPHLDVTIRDEDGAILAAGEVGEVCIAPSPAAVIGGRLEKDWGVSLDDGEPVEYRPMLGYWNRPEESAAALDGGFLRTGDAGVLGVDGA
jgi:acyl-CoA synthetase (AMP-forming)/AMP-acid ligase II